MNASATDGQTDRLIACLRDQQRSYEAFSALSQRQLGLISSSDTADLLSVLADKQRILQEIDAVEQRLAPLKQAWPELRMTLSPSVRAAVEEAIDQVRETLAQVIELERQSEQELCGQREATLAEIRRTSQGHNVHQAYQGTGRAAGNRYLDTTDEGASP